MYSVFRQAEHVQLFTNKEFDREHPNFFALARWGIRYNPEEYFVEQ